MKPTIMCKRRMVNISKPHCRKKCVFWHISGDGGHVYIKFKVKVPFQSISVFRSL